MGVGVQNQVPRTSVFGVFEAPTNPMMDHSDSWSVAKHDRENPSCFLCREYPHTIKAGKRRGCLRSTRSGDLGRGEGFFRGRVPELEKGRPRGTGDGELIIEVYGLVP